MTGLDVVKCVSREGDVVKCVSRGDTVRVYDASVKDVVRCVSRALILSKILSLPCLGFL